MTILEAQPYGIVQVIKLQMLNITSRLNFGRMIVPSQSVYTLNGEAVSWNIISMLDTDEDGYVSLREIINFIMSELNNIGVKLPQETYDNVQNYLAIMDNSIEILLKKYGLTDPNLCR